MPTGKSPVNQAGIDHYDYEINALLAAGITPYVSNSFIFCFSLFFFFFFFFSDFVTMI